MKNPLMHYQENQTMTQDIPFKKKITLRYEVTVILALAIIFIFFPYYLQVSSGPLSFLEYS